MKRLLLLVFILLLSSVVYAQRCPQTKQLSADKTFEINLNDNEREIWVKYGKDDKSLKLQLNSQNAQTAFKANMTFKTLEQIRARVQSAKDQNRLTIARVLKEKCMPAKGIRGVHCESRVLLLPEIKEEAIYVPEGVFAAVLRVKSEGKGKCEYQTGPVFPGLPKPKPVVEAPAEPQFNCNSIPYDALFSWEYVDFHKGPVKVYYWNDYEYRCVFKNNKWSLLSKKIVEFPARPWATAGVSSIGKIVVLENLFGNRRAGIIARTDGKSPTRIRFDVYNDELRRGQTVKFTTDKVTGVAFLVEPVT